MHDFVKRLPKHIQVDWIYVKHGSGEPETSKQQEAEAILRAIPANNQIILLDETGVQLTSPQLASKLFDQPRNTTFIIGGAYGVTGEIKTKSHFVWSLGSLVFPHQLVRVILAEQLYRAYSISIGHPYHHA